MEKDSNHVLNVQELIREAVKAGKHQVILPAGHWHVSQPTIHINGIQNLVIEGSGQGETVLYAGIGISDCEGITLRLSLIHI